MKFFNTYGRSRNFTVDGTEELLNSVNCDIHFKVSLFNSYSYILLFVNNTLNLSIIVLKSIELLSNILLTIIEHHEIQ